MLAVFATVGVPPLMATAPPLTSSLPAALRLTSIVLLTLSPMTESTPALNDAVTAGVMRSPNCSNVAKRHMASRLCGDFVRRPTSCENHCFQVRRDILLFLFFEIAFGRCRRG